MSDPDTTQGIIASLFGALGLSGAGVGGRRLWKQSQDISELRTRQDAVESEQKKHDETIETLKEQGTKTESTLTNFGSDMDEIKQGIAAIKNHITGTNLG